MGTQRTIISSDTQWWHSEDFLLTPTTWTTYICNTYMTLAIIDNYTDHLTSWWEYLQNSQLTTLRLTTGEKTVGSACRAALLAGNGGMEQEQRRRNLGEQLGKHLLFAVFLLLANPFLLSSLVSIFVVLFCCCWQIHWSSLVGIFFLSCFCLLANSLL